MNATYLKTLYALFARICSTIMVLIVIISAIGVNPVSAAPAGTALQFNGSSQYVTFGDTSLVRGTLTNAPTWNTTVNSKLGASSLTFNGTNQYVTFGAAPELGATNFTLETWFYWTGAGATTTTGTGGLATAIPLVTKGRGEAENSNLDMNYFLGISGGKLAADFEEGAGQPTPGLNHPITGNTTITQNAWHHAAVTYDSVSAVWTLYLDGVADGTLDLGSNISPRSDSIQHAGIGTAMTSTGVAAGFFAGRLDEARIWNVARTQSEIQASMNSEILVPVTGLLGRWGLNDRYNGGPNATSATASNLNRLGVTTFTLEAWVNRATGGAAMTTGTNGFDNTAGRPYIYPVVTRGMGEGEYPANLNMNYFLGITADGFVGADFEDTATGVNHPAWGTTNIPAGGGWHHIAATYTGSCWALYVDGNPETLNALATTCPNATPESTSYQYAGLAAGLNSTGGLGTGTGLGYFSGVIDEARVWNRALTPAEIAANKTLELTNGTGLIARWGMNEGTGTVVGDSATIPTTENGTTVNTPLWVTGFPIPDATPPTAPSGLNAAAPNYFVVNLTWTDNSNNETGFEIERSTTGSGGPFSLLTTTSAGAVSYADTAVIPVAEYCYRVRAVNGAGQSAYTDVTCATTATEGSSALQLGSSNAYVKFANSSSLNTPTFTVETWFRRDGTGVSTTTGTGGTNVEPIIAKGTAEGETANADINYILGINPTGNVLCADFEEAQSGASSSLNHPVCGTTAIVTGTWYHAAATYDGTTWKLYLNGNLDATLVVGQPANAANTAPASLGTSIQTNGTTLQGYFNGTLDEARIWNSARTQSQIRATINSEITTAQTGLIARWGLNEASGTAVYGSAGTTVNGAVGGTGNSWVTPGAPFNIVFDTTPPAAPTNLMASARPGAVQLEWTANTETDLAGYRIYRSTTSPVVKGTPINGTLVSPAFTDSTVTEGITYYYAVTAIDSSTNESPLSTETSAVPLPPPPAEALALGSAQAYVTFGNPPALGLPNFTVETWFKRTGTGVAVSTGSNGVTAIPLVTKGSPEADGSNVDENYILGIRSSDNVLAADFETFALCNSRPAGDNNPIVGVTPIVNDTWYHAAFTYDGTALKLYLNGNLESTLASTCIPRYDSIQHAGLGTYLTSTGVASGYFNGVLDEVRIWNVARTQAQIASAINTKMTTPQAGLVGRWGLDEASGAVANDSSGSGFNGAITGTGYGWVAGSPFNAVVNLPPDAPILVEPLNNASNVPTTATLSVNVTEPENSPLDVTFYGRPLQAAAGPDFTIAVIPDTQYYASAFPSIYNTQMQWVVNNATSNNIVYVAGLGDNVDVASNSTQWTNAKTAWDILDAAGVPYDLEAGNHDGAPSGTATFNTNFGVSRFTGKPWYGGHYGSDNDNHYALFTASGMNFIVVYIEYDDSMTATDHPVLQWANTLLQTYSTRRAIIVSHNMLQGGTSTAYSTQGQTIYNALKGNANLFLMLGGHLDVASRRTDTFNGNSVYTLRSDYQSVDSQQSGYLRIMRFSPSDDMIYIRTYSPTQNKDYDKSDAAQSNFNLPYAMDGTGYDVIGTATGVASGSTASMTWNGLDPSKQYEWFVIASDGTHQTSSDTWNFTTASSNHAPVCVGVTLTTNEDTTGQSDPSCTDVDGNTLTYSIVAQPSHGTASVVTGKLNYTPAANYNGPDSFTYKANDGTLDSNTATVSVTVTPVNDSPVITEGASTSVTMSEDGSPTPFSLTLHATDVEDNTLTWSIATPASHGTATASGTGLSKSIGYIPAANYNGSDSFVVQVSDGNGGVDTITINVTIQPINDAPVCVGVTLTTNEDTTGQSDPSCTDVDGNTLTYSIVAQPSHGSASVVAGKLNYTPAANYNGPDSFTYKANDGTLDSNTATVSVTVTPVNNAPIISEGASTNVTMSEDSLPTPFSLTLHATDVESNTLTWSIATPASHGTATASGTGLSKSIGYIPAANYNGSDSFVVQVSDGNGGVDTITVNVTIQPINDAPVCVGVTLTTNEDTTGQSDPSCTDVDGNTLTYSIVAQPSHGTASVVTGKLSYTPAANYNGPDSFTYKANDGTLDSNTATVSVTATPVNDVPVCVGVTLTTNEDTTGQSDPSCTDVDGNTLTYSIVAQPSHGTASVVTGKLNYTPAANYNGPDSFTYKANDGTLDSNTATVSVTVTPVNDPPVITEGASTSVTMSEDGSPTPFSLTLHATDVEGNTLTWSIATPASHGTATASGTGLSKSIGYIPAANYNGSDSFVVQVSDGNGGVDTITINVTIQPINDAPVCVGVTLTTNEDTTGQSDPSCTDVDGNTLTYSIVAQPSHGSASVVAGKLNYTPAANYNGPDSFTYKANDGTLDSNTATVSVTVTPVNDSPVITEGASTSVTMSEDGSPTPFSLTLHATDVEGNTLTWSIATPASHGTATASGTGLSKSIGYTPAANYNGSDSFVVQVSDGNGGVDTITVNVTIQPVNDAPLCVGVTLTTNEDTTGQSDPSCADVDGNTLTYSIVAQPSHGSASVVAGKLNYTPAANYNGLDSFTYKANDGTLDSNAATVSVTVTPVNDAPVCLDVTLTTDENSYVLIYPSCTDVDGNTLTYSIVAQPSHGTLSVVAGILRYTPPANYNGPDSFTYKANDGMLDSNTATVSVTVTPVNDAPIITEGASININMSQDGFPTPFSLTLNATDADGDPITWSISTAAGHGTASASGMGGSKAIGYTPTLNYIGSDSFVVQVSDGNGGIDTITVNVTITAVQPTLFTIYLPLILR